MAGGISHALDQALKDSDTDDAPRADFGGGGQQHIEARWAGYGRPKQFSGGKFGGQKTPGDLGHNVTPEKTGINKSNCFWGPLKLGKLAHFDCSHAHITTDAKTDYESESHQPSL